LNSRKYGVSGFYGGEYENILGYCAVSSPVS
jgi:hypothetical protein